jgi:plastocyanin
MRGAFLILICLSMHFCANAGTIVGTVRAEGKAQAGESGQGGKYDSRKYKFVEKINYAELDGFIVFIDQDVTNAPSVKPKTLQVITQRDACFHPHVLPLPVGTTVEWPNHDDIYHNVFSMSEPNSFDLGLYKDPIIKSNKFDHPGRVDVFCSIHTKMSCIILVLRNPYFASVDKAGKYRIENVPAGTYKIRAWHERVPAKSEDVVVPETGEVHMDFVLGIKGLPQF